MQKEFQNIEVNLLSQQGQVILSPNSSLKKSNGKEKSKGVQFQSSQSYSNMMCHYMEPIIDNQNKCHDYLDELQPTIDRTIERQDQIMEKRFQSIFNALDRAKNNLIKYRESILDLKNSIDKSDHMRQTIIDVQNFKGYSQLLSQDIDNLNEKIGEQLTRAKKLKVVVKYKHKVLGKMNYVNLMILRDINKTKGLMHNQKTSQVTTPKNQFQLLSDNKTIDQNQLDIIQQIEQLKQSNNLLKQQIVLKSNNYFQKLTLFQECLETFKRQLEKSQKVVNSNKGLQGSLLFEMKRAQLFLTETEVFNKQAQKGPKSSLQSREISSLIHDTLKGMIQDREGKRCKYLKDFFIEWDTLKEFNPIQLLGVMALKPKMFEELIMLLEIKARNIKLHLHQNRNSLT